MSAITISYFHSKPHVINKVKKIPTECKKTLHTTQPVGD